jgi:2,4-dienoyl-CoA reductase-like NADH-dependent reductase (Old Yellow Enzyme family)/thioredoxin reductase
MPDVKSDPFVHLSSPLQIGQWTLKNRFVVPAMGTGYATPDGLVTQQLLDYYEARARGGAGMIIVETTTVEFPRGVHASNKLVADTDLAIPGLKALADVIRRQGALPILQLNHAGRMGKLQSNGIQPVSASAIAAPGGQVPRALREDEIALIVQRFGRAAQRAEAAGFAGCEVHAAHGYLLGAFASHVTNQRTDRYGGSLENRARFLQEVLAAMRASTGSQFLTWCRINGQEFGDPAGMSLQEGMQFAALVAPLVDALSVSVRGHGSRSLVNYPDVPGALLPVAAAIKSVVDVPVIAVGRLTHDVAEQALASGQCDLIAIGRQSIADPDTPQLVLTGRAEEVRPCIACFYCADWGAKVDRPIACQVNAAVGKESQYGYQPVSSPKHVVVVGAGPAGMEASRVLALRGHRVTLLEKEPHLGGQLAQAAIPPHKDRLRPLLDYFSRQLERLQVRVITSQAADVATVVKLQPDTVLFAAGARQAIPAIPGVDLPLVTTPIDILYGRYQPGSSAVVIGGGLTGCEVAEFLDEQGVKTTIIHPHHELAREAGSSERSRAIAHLSQRPVEVVLGARCTAVLPDGVRFRHADGQERQMLADTVVLACGVVPDNSVYQELSDAGLDVHMMGDCWRPGMIATAVADGARWGNLL